MGRADAHENCYWKQCQEEAAVKLVIRNGTADRCGVSVGSLFYESILEIICLSPRPMTARFKNGAVNRDTTQGSILVIISGKSDHAIRDYKTYPLLPIADGTFHIVYLSSDNAI